MTRHPRTALALVLVALATAGAAQAVSAYSRAFGPRAAGPPAVTLKSGSKTFTGTGNKTLGTLRVRRAATLSWRHPSGGRFQITTGRKRPFVLLSTTRKTGSTTLRRGTYTAVRIFTKRGWRVTLRIKQ